MLIVLTINSTYGLFGTSFFKISIASYKLSTVDLPAITYWNNPTTPPFKASSYSFSPSNLSKISKALTE